MTIHESMTHPGTVVALLSFIGKEVNGQSW